MCKALARILREDDAGKLAELLTYGGIDINSHDNKYGWTLLHKAAGGGHHLCTQLLLAHGAEVNALDKKKCTPIARAAGGGHHLCTQLLLAHGAELNALDIYEWTPIARAAAGGHHLCMQLLLDHGAEVNPPHNQNVWTPLHEATGRGSLECMQLLLDHGAEVNPPRNKNVCTPLHTAADCENPECVQLLLDHGAEVNATEQNWHRPLHLAARRGHLECMQLLLSHGAEVNVQSIFKHTPLQAAACCGNYKCMQLLLSHGAEVKTDIVIFNSLPPGAQRLITVAHAIKDKVTEFLEAACAEGQIDPDLKDAAKSIANKIIFSSDKSLEELASEESEDFINTSICQATADTIKLHQQIEKSDSATQSFVLANIYLLEPSLGSDFKHWSLQELGPKKTLVNLAALCGERIEGITNLLGHQHRGIKIFLDTIPVNEDGTIVKYSVGEFVLRVVSKNPMKFIGGEDITKHIASFLGLGDVDLSGAALDHRGFGDLTLLGEFVPEDLPCICCVIS